MKRDWRLLWTASTVTSLGDGVFVAVLPLLAATLTTDPRLIAGVTAWGTLPWLLAALPAGAIVDRSDGRRALVVVQCCQALLVGALAVVSMMDAGTMAVLYGVAFALGTAETFAKVTVQKLIPAVTPSDRLETANGQQNAAMFAMKLFLGPPIGALLFSFSAALPLWLDVAAFAVSVTLVARLTVRTVASGRSPAGGVWAGARWLAGHRVLRTLTMLTAVANLANFMTVSTLVLFARQRLGLDEVGYGVLLSAMGVGGVLGSLVSGRLIGRFGGRAVVTTTIFTTPVAMLGVASLATDLPTMAALTTVTSAGASLWNVASTSLRQRTVPSGLIGRVSSAGLMVSWGMQPIGAVLGGLVAVSPLGIAGPWMVAGALRLLAAVLATPVLRDWPAVASADLDHVGKA
ncbi:MFS transporter [Virgisporangium aurantiacum]|uniref:MFS transporter n=1 Tax=Virgisporangium aurantiacum TaxID=175570 RepID=A0A8J3ZBB5_9ACTN|nr:MFS transporter [Virgisporangium aurantiacum]GIJ58551.1 MFS transporter [Virgisporangium aurantiacum]